MTQNKRIIGITGNSGSGKTTVANIITEGCGHKINADNIVHKLMEPNQMAYKKIVAAFGPHILDDSIAESPAPINRKKLRQIVFTDEEKRTKLESILHPMVIEEVLSEIAAVNASLITVDAVLLVESGLHHHCDELWLVTAPADIRLERITSRDNLSGEDAQTRMRNQRDTAHIAAIADVIIENNTDNIESLKSQIQKAMA